MFIFKDSWVRLRSEGLLEEGADFAIPEPKAVKKRAGHQRNQSDSQVPAPCSSESTCKWRAIALKQAQVMHEIEQQIGTAFEEVRAKQAEANAREEKLLEVLEKCEIEKNRLELEVSALRKGQVANSSPVQELLVSRVESLLDKLHQASAENDNLLRELTSLKQKEQARSSSRSPSREDAPIGALSSQPQDKREGTAQGVPSQQGAGSPQRDPQIPPPWELLAQGPTASRAMAADSKVRVLRPLSSNGAWREPSLVAANKQTQKVIGRVYSFELNRTAALRSSVENPFLSTVPLL